MKKLYLATTTITAMFIADDYRENLNMLASNFVRAEMDNLSYKDFVLKEVTKAEDIPLASKGTNLWNTDNDLTPEEFLADARNADPEYHTYLKLKEKFKKYEDE